MRKGTKEGMTDDRDLSISGTSRKTIEKSIPQRTYGFLAGGGIGDVMLDVLGESWLDVVVFGSVFSSKIHSSTIVEVSFELVSFWNDKITQNIGI